MAFLTTTMEKGAEMANRPVTCYIDNDALLGILKNYAMPVSIQATAGLIWHRIRELNITPPPEHFPSKRNVADLPTRRTEIKYKAIKMGEFRLTVSLNRLIENTIDRVKKGLPTEPPALKEK